MNSAQRAALCGVLGLVSAVAWAGMVVMALIAWGTGAGTGGSLGWQGLTLALATLLGVGLVPAALFATAGVYLSGASRPTPTQEQA